MFLHFICNCVPYIVPSPIPDFIEEAWQLRQNLGMAQERCYTSIHPSICPSAEEKGVSQWDKRV